MSDSTFVCRPEFHRRLVYCSSQSLWLSWSFLPEPECFQIFVPQTPGWRTIAKTCRGLCLSRTNSCLYIPKVKGPGFRAAWWTSSSFPVEYKVDEITKMEASRGASCGFETQMKVRQKRKQWKEFTSKFALLDQFLFCSKRDEVNVSTIHWLVGVATKVVYLFYMALMKMCGGWEAMEIRRWAHVLCSFGLCHFNLEGIKLLLWMLQRIVLWACLD